MCRRLTPMALVCLLLSAGIAGADDGKKKDKFQEAYDAFAGLSLGQVGSTMMACPPEAMPAGAGLPGGA